MQTSIGYQTSCFNCLIKCTKKTGQQKPSPFGFPSFPFPPIINLETVTDRISHITASCYWICVLSWETGNFCETWIWNMSNSTESAPNAYTCHLLSQCFLSLDQMYTIGCRRCSWQILTFLYSYSFVTIGLTNDWQMDFVMSFLRTVLDDRRATNARTLISRQMPFWCFLTDNRWHTSSNANLGVIFRRDCFVLCYSVKVDPFHPPTPCTCQLFVTQPFPHCTLLRSGTYSVNYAQKTVFFYNSDHLQITWYYGVGVGSCWSRRNICPFTERQVTGERQ